MNKIICAIMLLTMQLCASKVDFDLIKPEEKNHFYYFMLGSSSPVSHLLWTTPEFSFGLRSLRVTHGWDFSIGASINKFWEELYLQGSYNYHPFKNCGAFVGFGGRYGGYHVTAIDEETGKEIHGNGSFSNFSFLLGYEFLENIPGFVQAKVSTHKNLTLSYGFGF